MAARPTWGVNSDVLKIIYRGAVEEIVLYCATAFETVFHRRWAREKLAHMQRGFVLRITRAYAQSPPTLLLL